MFAPALRFKSCHDYLHSTLYFNRLLIANRNMKNTAFVSAFVYMRDKVKKKKKIKPRYYCLFTLNCLFLFLNVQ